MTDEKPDFSKQAEENYYTQEISFKEIILGVIAFGRYILSLWIYILLIAIIGGAIGLIKANRQQVQFVAFSTFILDDGGTHNDSPGGFASLLGLGSSASGGGIFQGDNLLQLYRSALMIKKTLLSPTPDSPNVHVIDRYMQINYLRQAWKDSVKLRNINFFAHGNKRYTRIQDSLMNVFVNDIRNNYLNVNRDRQLSILYVETRSRNEEFAKLLNDQIVKTVNDFYIQTKTQKSIEYLALLRHQADSIRTALHSAMYRISSNADWMTNGNPARDVLRIPSQSNQVDAQTNRDMLNELVRNIESAKMSLKKETPLIQQLDVASFPLERRRESRAKAVITGCILAAMIALFWYTVVFIYKRIMR